jgi:hypothetical protein
VFVGSEGGGSLFRTKRLGCDKVVGPKKTPDPLTFDDELANNFVDQADLLMIHSFSGM